MVPGELFFLYMLVPRKVRINPCDQALTDISPDHSQTLITLQREENRSIAFSFINRRSARSENRVEIHPSRPDKQSLVTGPVSTRCTAWLKLPNDPNDLLFTARPRRLLLLIIQTLCTTLGMVMKTLSIGPLLNGLIYENFYEDHQFHVSFSASSKGGSGKINSPPRRPWISSNASD